MSVGSCGSVSVCAGNPLFIFCFLFSVLRLAPGDVVYITPSPKRSICHLRDRECATAVAQHVCEDHRATINRTTILTPLQYRPSHNTYEIGLRLTSILRARSKAPFLVLYFFTLVPDKTFFTKSVRQCLRAHGLCCYFIYYSIIARRLSGKY